MDACSHGYAPSPLKYELKKEVVVRIQTALARSLIEKKSFSGVGNWEGGIWGRAAALLLLLLLLFILVQDTAPCNKFLPGESSRLMAACEVNSVIIPFAEEMETQRD
jgi:hypothetical protein